MVGLLALWLSLRNGVLFLEFWRKCCASRKVNLCQSAFSSYNKLFLVSGHNWLFNYWDYKWLVDLQLMDLLANGLFFVALAIGC